MLMKWNWMVRLTNRGRCCKIVSGKTSPSCRNVFINVFHIIKKHQGGIHTFGVNESRKCGRHWELKVSSHTRVYCTEKFSRAVGCMRERPD